MDKKRIEIIITSLLVLVLFFAWGNTIKKFKQRGGKKPVLPVASLEVAPPPATIYPESQERGLEWGRDPFSGNVYFSSQGGVDLKLTGILWDLQNPQALINDRICEKGDKIDGFQIIEIQENKVILTDQARQIELKLD